MFIRRKKDTPFLLFLRQFKNPRVLILIFAAIVSMITGSWTDATIILAILPLLPKQILLNNFLSDITATTIATDTVDPEMVTQPRRWNIAYIWNFMLVFGLSNSAIDFLTFGLMLGVLKVNQDQFLTGWFIKSLLTELFVFLLFLTRRPFFRSRPGRWLWISTFVVGLITLIVPYLPGLQLVFDFVPLPPLMVILLLAINLLYIVANEGVKTFFFRRTSYLT